MNTIKTSFSSIFSTLVLLLLLSMVSAAQTSVITYQGKLTEVGAPSNGLFDLTFKLFTTPSEGSASVTVLAEDVPVTAGIFTVNLNFGTLAFTGNPPPDYFIEIAVRPGASTSGYTTLSPRQPLTSSPYAIQAIRAASAAVADNALQLGGIDAGEYVQDSDGRLTDARIPLAGSSNYVQSNPATQQPGTNLNIGGNATVGSTLSGNVVNATTQYNIGGSRVLGVAGANNFFGGVGAGENNTGTENAFVGSGAGQSNTAGQSNAFFGAAAGQTNATGNFNAFFGSGTGFANIGGGENSFFGYTAGRLNTSGSINSFFGKSAGFSNTTGRANSFFGYNSGYLNAAGANNTFVGVIAGDSNTVGSFNTILGAQADVASNNLNYATAIGAESVVTTSNTVVLGRTADTVRVPGSLNVTGTFTGNFTVPASNITGVLAAENGGTGPAGSPGNFLRSNGANWAGSPIQSSDLPAGSSNYIQNIPGTGQQIASFNINGGAAANIFNAATQYNIGGNRILSSPGAFNLFAGVGAGAANTTGGGNSYVGANSGTSNTSGFQNSFFGNESGRINSSGNGNSFFGARSGLVNSGGSGNSFFGYDSGILNETNNNSFLGFRSGGNTSSGDSNTFVGYESGAFNTTGRNNTVIGARAHVGAHLVTNINNSIAIGADAMVLQSDSVVIGAVPGINGATADIKVGIGTATPKTKLHIVGGSIYVANPNTLIITSPNGACWGITVNNAGGLSTFPVVPCP